MYNELNVIEHTWTTDYWAERCHLVSPLGLIVAAGASWEALGLSEGLLGESWGPLGASWEGLGASGGGLGASWSGLLGVCCHKVIFYNLLGRFGIDLEAQMGPQRS